MPAHETFGLEQAEELIADLRGSVHRLEEILTQYDGPVPPTPSPSGYAAYSAGGQQQYVGFDGNAYYTGRLTVRNTTTFAIQTTFTVITGFQVALTAGYIYHFRSQMLINPTASGGTLAYQVGAGGSGLVATNIRCSIVEMNATAAPPAALNLSEYVSALGTVLTGAAIGTGLNSRIVTFDGMIQVGTSGTLNPQVRLSAGAASLVQWGSYIEAFPCA